MKKIAVLLTAAITLFAMVGLTGCGSGSDAYNYDLSKYIKVGEYKGLTYEKPDKIKISKKDIQSAVKEELEANQDLKDVKDKKVHDGDTINIDYTGTVNGKKFDGGSAKGTTVVVGQDNFIDGFTSGLIGKKVGKTVTLNLKFPDPYENNKDLSGKKVKFKVKINSAQEYVTPSEKAYVKNKTEYKSVSDYEKSVKERLKKEAEEDQQSQIQSELWQQIYDSSEVIKYPEKELQDYIDTTTESIKKYAEDSDMEFADFLQQYYGMNEEDFNKQMKTASEENAKSHMIVYYIADKEKIKVSDDEYDKFKEEQLEQIGYSEEDFKEYTGQTYEEYVGGAENITYYLTYQKVMDLVQKKAKAK